MQRGASSRRRGERLEHAILDAAWQILTEAGYANLTMEAVAARAGTSRPVINRRWATRADLALATMEYAAPAPAVPPESGSLRGDLLGLLHHTAGRLDPSFREVLTGMIADTARDPDAAAPLRGWLASGTPIEQVRTIVGRAAERGEIPEHVLPERLARLPFDLVRNEVVLNGSPPPAETIAEIVDTIILPLIRSANNSPGQLLGVAGRPPARDGAADQGKRAGPLSGTGLG